MKGLELSERYFYEYGLPMLRDRYPEYLERIAAGLAGEGSECYGYDDEISQDHDFFPRFCIWLNDVDYAKIGESMQNDYESLPGQFLGFQKEGNDYHAGGRQGVMRISDFFRNHTGCAAGPQTAREWLRVPEYMLAGCTNGRIFIDNAGDFTAVRAHITNEMPEDVRKKKIAAALFAMAQAGQYNFPRSVKRGDMGAAHMALNEFVKASIRLCYLLDNRYCPYYKWMFRGLKDLTVMPFLYDTLIGLLDTPSKDYGRCIGIVEEICIKSAGELKKQKLAFASGDYLEPYALGVQQSIEDPQVRAMHVSVG